MTQTLIEKLQELPTYQQDRFGDLEPARGDNVPHWIKWSDLDAIIEEYKETEQEPIYQIMFDGIYQDVPLDEYLREGMLEKRILFTHPHLSDETVKVPEGYAIVPINPTPKMLQATWEDDAVMAADGCNGIRAAMYRAMIDEAMKAEREATKA